MLAVIFLARVSMALQFQSVAPVASLLVADLDLSYAQLGLLIGLYLLPGTVVAFPGGMLGQRFGNRRVALWGLGLMTLGGFGTAISHAFWLAAAGRLVSGTGGVLLTLVLTKMTAEWFAGKEITTGMSVMLTGWPFGIALGTACFGAIGTAVSWRAVEHVTTATTALSFAILALVYRDAPGVVVSDRVLRFWPALPARAWARSLTAGFAWMLFNVGFIVLVGFGPAFLGARGTSIAEAGVMVSLAVWISALSVPVGGAIVDRVGRSDLGIVVGCLLSALAMMVVPLLPGTVAWLFLAGLLLGPAPGAIVALVPRSLEAEHLAAGYGVSYATYYLGTAVMQPMAGMLRDLTGHPGAPIFFAAAMMALTVVALGAFRWIDRARIPV
jgi:MFS family permease